VHRFPFVIFFHEHKEMIRVLAIAHGKRRPGYWARRT
jgi:toxin ParE1/3/4